MGNIVSIHRVIAVLNLPDNISAFISYVKSIIMAMTGNSDFTTPSPTLVNVSANIKTLEDAEASAHTRTIGTAERRDVAKAAVLKDLRSLLAYVQGIADNNPANAQAIILGAGMSVKQTGARMKPDFAAKYTVSGSLALIVKSAGPNSAYEWQKSIDEETWTALPTKLVASTTVSGLTPGTTYHFRYRIVRKSGTGNWSQILSVVAI